MKENRKQRDIFLKGIEDKNPLYNSIITFIVKNKSILKTITHTLELNYTYNTHSTHTEIRFMTFLQSQNNYFILY